MDSSLEILFCSCKRLDVASVIHPDMLREAVTYLFHQFGCLFGFFYHFIFLFCLLLKDGEVDFVPLRGLFYVSDLSDTVKHGRT